MGNTQKTSSSVPPWLKVLYFGQKFRGADRVQSIFTPITLNIEPGKSTAKSFISR